MEKGYITMEVEDKIKWLMSLDRSTDRRTTMWIPLLHESLPHFTKGGSGRRTTQVCSAALLSSALARSKAAPDSTPVCGSNTMPRGRPLLATFLAHPSSPELFATPPLSRSSAPALKPPPIPPAASASTGVAEPEKGVAAEEEREKRADRCGSVEHEKTMGLPLSSARRGLLGRIGMLAAMSTGL